MTKSSKVTGDDIKRVSILYLQQLLVLLRKLVGIGCDAEKDNYYCTNGIFFVQIYAHTWQYVRYVSITHTIQFHVNRAFRIRSRELFRPFFQNVLDQVPWYRSGRKQRFAMVRVCNKIVYDLHIRLYENTRQIRITQTFYSRDD